MKQPNMTPRHFQFIAETIRNMPVFAASLRTQRESCASAFADALAATHGHFDRKRFMTEATRDNKNGK